MGIQLYVHRILLNDLVPIAVLAYFRDDDE